MKPSHKTLTILGMFLLILSACATNQPPSKDGNPESIGADVEPLYTLPATYQDHRDQQILFSFGGENIAYTDTGKKNATASTIVLLHGVPTSSWMYRKVIPGLQKNMRVITIDFLGYGSSDKPDDTGGIYTNQRQAERVLGLLASLNIDQYSLLMHDMGGLVTWEIMRINRENIDNLIVLNTIVNNTGFNNPDADPGIFTRQMMKAYSSPLTSSLVLSKVFKDMGLSHDHKLTKAECQGYIEPINEGSDPALYEFYTSFNETLFARLNENRTLFKDYKGNTLVMWGEKDTTLTTAQIPILQETLSIPDENIHIYPDNEHFLAEEIPDEIVEKVTLFMQGN